MLDLVRIRDDFQQTDSKIYLNAGLIGFPAKSVFENTLKFYQELYYNPEPRFFENLEKINALWDRSAPVFLNCRIDEIVGVPNTTMGMNLITQAIPWQPGDNVVINELEFVSQYIAFQHFRKKLGFEIRVAKREGWCVPPENIISLIDDRTRLVALSHVAFVNGFRHNVRAIADEARAKGAYVALDAIQSMGPLLVDVKKLGVDFLTAGSSKWMMSLPGWGVLFVRKEIIQELNRPVAGFLGLENPEGAIQDWCDGLDFVKPYPITNSRVDKFRVSTENLLAKISLAYSMQNFMAIGRQEIEKHILDLSGYFMEKLLQFGHQVRSVREAEKRSGIVSFLPRKSIPDFQQLLENENIYICRRGGGYRVSIHVYNTKEEIDRLMEVIERICR